MGAVLVYKIDIGKINKVIKLASTFEIPMCPKSDNTIFKMVPLFTGQWCDYASRLD